MFTVMLHDDMNADRILDFNDGIAIPDAPRLQRQPHD